MTTPALARRSPTLSAEERSTYERIRTRIHRAERDAKKLPDGPARARAEARIAKNIAARDAFVLATGIPSLYPAPPQRIRATFSAAWSGRDGSHGMHVHVVEMALDYVDVSGPRYRTTQVISDTGAPPPTTPPRGAPDAMGIAWFAIDDQIRRGQIVPLCGYQPAGPRRVVNDRDLYITDNGRVVCGRHCGTTAAFTGRDISGQPIMKVDDHAARGWLVDVGEPVHCEDCGTFDHPVLAEDESDGIMMAMTGGAS